jgi:hypothetical protein
MIAPHRRKRRKQCTQDGRKLRRYKRRWKVERLFAWLQNFRRLVVRYEYHADNFLGMVQLGCAIILLRFFSDGFPSIYADLGELVTGKKKGLENAKERTIAANLGLAIDDLAVAPLVVERAKSKGIGTWLPL